MSETKDWGGTINIFHDAFTVWAEEVGFYPRRSWMH